MKGWLMEKERCRERERKIDILTFRGSVADKQAALTQRLCKHIS